MFTVITSLYQSEKYLADYIKMVKRFARYFVGKNIAWELLLIANDPSDYERSKCQDIINIEGVEVRFIEVPREPLYATWNRGVGLAKYSIIGFWNVDDWRFSGGVANALDLFERGAELVYFPFIILWFLKIFKISFPVKFRVDNSAPFERKEFTRSMRCGPFFMFTKDLYDRVGPFDEQFKIVGDFDWCVRAAKITDKFVLATKKAGIFRVDGGGLSSGGKPIHTAENNIVCLRHDAMDKVIPVDQSLLNKYRVDSIFYKGQYLSLGNVKGFDMHYD